MRLTEGNRQLVPAALHEKPVSEARMRAHEQVRYVPPPAHQNSTRAKEFDRRHTKPQPMHTTPALAQATAKSGTRNPFDDDDDATGNNYDDSKNPFADSVDMAANAGNTKDAKAVEPSTNPFGDFED